MLVSLLIGVTIGLVAGYFGGWVDAGLMWLVDLVLTMPTLLLGGESTGRPSGTIEDFVRGLGAGPNIRGALVGRNVLYGRWTFQIVEEFDDSYWSLFRDHERRVREELQNGARHVFEAEMKEKRRSIGRSGHEGRP